MKLLFFVDGGTITDSKNLLKINYKQYEKQKSKNNSSNNCKRNN